MPANGARVSTWIVTNLGLLVVAGLAIVEVGDHALYRQLVQEDGPVEWATVAAFVMAAFTYGQAARRLHRETWRGAVFPLVMVAFCLFVAAEELSWGQRVLSYRPPTYFLEHNAQQEANIHNLFKSVLRTKYLLIGLLVGWGVLAPLLSRWRPGWFDALRSWGFQVAPISSLPTTIGALGLLVFYPWPYSGEVAELLFGLLLLTAVGLSPHGAAPMPSARKLRRTALAVAAALGVGLGIPFGTELLASPHDPRIAVSEHETARLGQDWLAQLEASGQTPSGCGTHVRVFTWVRSHGHERVRHGDYATGAPVDERYESPERRRYFIDPWNNPYWLWHLCDEHGQRVRIYSFGPNQRRDSRPYGFIGDDVGVTLRR